MKLYINAGPPTPVNAVRNELCSATFSISWDPFTSDPVCGPVSYDVTISPTAGVVMMRITDFFYLLTDLLFRTNYSVTVASKNDAGVGDSSVLTFYIPAGMYNKLYCQYYYAI